MALPPQLDAPRLPAAVGSDLRDRGAGGAHADERHTGGGGLPFIGEGVLRRWDAVFGARPVGLGVLARRRLGARQGCFDLGRGVSGK